MKKFIFITAFIIMAGIAYGQTYEKGNVIGQHVVNIVLDPDVTFNQYKDFMINKYIPEFNKVLKGDIKLYIAEGERGADVNCISFLYVFKSVEMRDKYFDEQGQATELANSKFGQLSAIGEERDKLGTSIGKHYTDWVMQ